MTADPQSPEALIERTNERWFVLHGLLANLADEDKERPLTDGWSAKVHLAHLTAWEESLLALLSGANRAEAMGIPHDLWATHDNDAINRVIAERSDRLPLGAVVARAEAVHAMVLATLGKMTRTDLDRPYSYYQPGGPAGSDGPVVGWIHGNTWEHYDEHIGWLEAGLSER